MNPTAFIDLLSKEGFAQPVEVVGEHNLFIEQRSFPYEQKALVLEGQVDIIIGAQRAVYLAGDVFHLEPNQMYAESYGSKGVKYLLGIKQAE